MGSEQEEDTKSEMRFGSTHPAAALSSSGFANEATAEHAPGQADAKEEEEGVEEGREAKPRSGTAAGALAWLPLHMRPRKQGKGLALRRWRTGITAMVHTTRRGPALRR